jgi:signal transduction histidine kinase
VCSSDLWLDFGAGMIHVGGKPAALGIAFDITERKKVENQLNASYQQMRQLTARLQAVREEESARIAREIHDELGQTLTGIKMDLSFLEEALIEKHEYEKANPLLKKLNSMSELADGAIQTVRKIATELRPAILDSMGISAAIEWQAEELEHRTGIKCEYTSTLENLKLDREHSTAIFRILQESLTNIVRHAKATKVNITLKEEADGLVLEIQDNGKGISESDVKKKNSFGLLGMKERAWLLGGRVDVQGVQGKGTTIKVKIPLK